MHIFPKGEESIHSPGDYCVCSPFATVDYHGQLTWHHQPIKKVVEINEQDLVTQAELLKSGESAYLFDAWYMAKKSPLHIFYPWPSNEPIKMPGTTTRRK